MIKDVETYKRDSQLFEGRGNSGLVVNFLLRINVTTILIQESMPRISLPLYHLSLLSRIYRSSPVDSLACYRIMIT